MPLCAACGAVTSPGARCGNCSSPLPPEARAPAAPAPVVSSAPREPMRRPAVVTAVAVTQVVAGFFGVLAFGAAMMLWLFVSFAPHSVSPAERFAFETMPPYALVLSILLVVSGFMLPSGRTGARNFAWACHAGVVALSGWWTLATAGLFPTVFVLMAVGAAVALGTHDANEWFERPPRA